LFPNLFYHAGFIRTEEGIYHARQNSWQRHFGFNEAYDFFFGLGTYKQSDYFEFSHDGQNYRIWIWKGDYLNLGAGAELGIYRQNRFISRQWDVDTNLAMRMSLTVYYQGQQFISWDPSLDPNFPNNRVWWLTGFDPSRQRPSIYNLSVRYIVYFNSLTKFNDFRNRPP